VARETFEEVGIRIDLDSIKYIGSQPWPFPQSCMIAFTAKADETQPFTIDTKELIDAKWFSREDVLNAASKIQEDSSVGNVMSSEQAKIVLNNNPSLSLLIPPKRVIARTLIDEWLHNTPNKV
jgi:NADH pyrophosphatase NudC (nudix superfamily)